MTAIEGQYFDGCRPIGVPARMDVAEQEVTLTARSELIRCGTSQLRVSPRIGSADRFVCLPDGGQFACADNPLLDSLPQESPSEGLVAWLEERWGFALACVAVIVCAVTVGYFWGLPAAEERIAAHLPMKTEQSLGNQALTWMEGNGWFKPTILVSGVRNRITEGFEKLRSDLPLKDYYRLEFRSSTIFGPNALAFPGGLIVVTDEMVRVAETPEETIAVLAHEMGHVELRHAMRSVLQNSLVAAAAAAVTSDASSLSIAVAGFPMLVAERKYSRGFEAAADEYAFKLLKRKRYSPAAFASLMERLARIKGEEEGPVAYISSHPGKAERVQRVRKVAAE
jgi:Zn-dependent protease with chaperone function